MLPLSSLADYHVHTPLCRHAAGEPMEYVRVAQARGLAQIGFSDHCPMDGPEPFDDWRMLRSELPRYVEMILDARSQAAPYPVRLGLECDFIAGREDWIEQLAGLAPWDYLIGSVHYLAPGWDVDNPKHISRFEAAPGAVEDIWTLYWREFGRCARSGLFDILAHPDLVKKFGHRPSGDLRRFYEPAIEAIVAGGSAIELSTAGLRKPVGELYPAPDFLALACAAGIPIVISSDAHAPEEAGADFELAMKAANVAGYNDTIPGIRGRERQSRKIKEVEPS